MRQKSMSAIPERTARARRRTWRSVVLLVVVAVVGVLVAAQPASAAATDKWLIYAEAGFPSNCLDVTGGSTANSAIIQQYTCHEGTNQQWYMKSFGSTDYWQIQNVK